MYIRLPLKQAYNVRDLGGYATKTGKVTAFRQFIRSDDVANLSKEDITFLKDYGVTAILDLRSEMELMRAPNPFCDDNSFHYLHKSLFSFKTDEAITIDTIKEMLQDEKRNLLGEMYIHMLEESKEEIRTIFNWFSEQKGCVLFHCTAGKDRTGIIAMLLLGLAGVNKADIIVNYTVTHIYNSENPNEKMINLPIEVPNHLLESQPQFMLKAYKFLINKYESIETYLHSIGIEKAVLDKVKEKLITTI